MLGGELGLIPGGQHRFDQLRIGAEPSFARPILRPFGPAVLYPLHGETQATVGGPVAERIHRLLALAHALHLLLQHLAEEDDAAVTGAELLQVTLCDVALRHPGHVVLVEGVVQDPVAIAIHERHVAIGDGLLAGRRPSCSTTPMARSTRRWGQ